MPPTKCNNCGILLANSQTFSAWVNGVFLCASCYLIYTGVYGTNGPASQGRNMNCQFCNRHSVLLWIDQRTRLWICSSCANMEDNVTEIKVSNGDSEEYVKIEFPAFTEEGKVLHALMEMTLAKPDRTFDFRRKCWFVKTEMAEILLKAVKAGFIDNPKGSMRFLISDKRVQVEAFEEFFKEPEAGLAPKTKKSKSDLEVAFISICVTTNGEMCFPTDKEGLKKAYRKASMKLHPDRNNGDGSKMSELNQIWSELQEYL